MLKEVDRIGGLRVAGRATVGAPPASAGGPNGPAGAPTVAAEPKEGENIGKGKWTHRTERWSKAVGQEGSHPGQCAGIGRGRGAVETGMGSPTPAPVPRMDRPLPHAA